MFMVGCWYTAGIPPVTSGMPLVIKKSSIVRTCFLNPLSPLKLRSRFLENPRSSRLEFLETLSLDSAAQAKNFFVFGCGWWYDREIVLLPPLQRVVYVNTDERDYERDYQEALPQGRTAADGHKPRHGRGDRHRGSGSAAF